MKIFLKNNVYEEALKRIRFLFDEFEEISVGISGGKDSTIVYQLAKIVAREKNRLPLSVFWIDQEAEWKQTVDMVREIMYDPEVKPYWFQIPMLLSNACSFKQQFLHCWEEGGEWLREKDPIAIKENTYDEDRFAKLFGAIFRKEFKGKNHCCLAGVRAEESPTRSIALTQGITYKWITWGNKIAAKDNHFTFYPIYDWSYTDVWKAIYDNDWSYNKIYDYQYRYGVPVRDMRVSNLHHETAVRSLFYLQEIDPELYGKLASRLHGVDMAGKMNYEDYFVKKLPFMFTDWAEYRDHLVSNLVTDEVWLKAIKNFIEKCEKTFGDDDKLLEKSAKVVVSSILVNDYSLTKFGNFTREIEMYLKDKKRQQRFLKETND